MLDAWVDNSSVGKMRRIHFEGLDGGEEWTPNRPRASDSLSVKKSHEPCTAIIIMYMAKYFMGALYHRCLLNVQFKVVFYDVVSRSLRRSYAAGVPVCVSPCAAATYASLP